MKKQTLLFVALISVLFFTSCASAKENAWLKAHHTQLEQAAASTASAETKMDILLTNYAVMMEEGLKFVNPIKGAKYIEKYQKQNAVAIEKIIAESDAWRQNLSTEQSFALGFRIAKKPYINKFVDLDRKSVV